MIASMLGKCVCVGLCMCVAVVSTVIGSQLYACVYEKFIEEKHMHIFECTNESIV